MRAAVLSLLVLSLTCVSGCIDYSEDVHLYSSGAGKFVMEWGYPEELFEDPSVVDETKGNLEKTALELRRNPKVTGTSVESWTTEGKQHFSLAADVSDWSAIPTLFDSAEDEVIGSDGPASIRLEKLDGTRVRFVRTLNEAEESRVRARCASISMKHRLRPRNEPVDEREYHYTFRVHAPKIVSAELAGIDGGTASWQFTFEDFTTNRTPGEISAELDVAGRSWLLPIAALVGLGLGFSWLKKKWDRRAA